MKKGKQENFSEGGSNARKVTDKNKLKRLTAITATSVLICVAVVVGVFFVLFYRGGDYVEFSFPDFAGSYEENLPDAYGIKIEKRYVYSDFYPQGVIISQTPGGLSEKKISSNTTPVMVLYISLGKEKFAISDLSGQDFLEAERQLRRMQCKIKVVRLYDYTEDYADNTVIRTVPEAGDDICVGDTVTVHIACKRAEGSFKVPSVVGLCAEDAKKILENSGSEIIFEDGYDKTCGGGRVISQYPYADTYVLRGTPFTLTINSD